MNAAARVAVDPARALAAATVEIVAAELDDATARALADADPVAVLAFADRVDGNHRHRAKIALRDGCLRELHRRFGMSAAAISEAMLAYETTAWRRGDRVRPTCPPAYGGTPRELLFLAFRTLPTSLRRRAVEYILADEIAQRGRPPFCADDARISSRNGE